MESLSVNAEFEIRKGAVWEGGKGRAVGAADVLNVVKEFLEKGGEKGRREMGRVKGHWSCFFPETTTSLSSYFCIISFCFVVISLLPFFSLDLTQQQPHMRVINLTQQ